jgi:hypothetical protein
MIREATPEMNRQLNEQLKLNEEVMEEAMVTPQGCRRFRVYTRGICSLKNGNIIIPTTSGPSMGAVDVLASEVLVEDGDLLVAGESGETILILARGAWTGVRCVEREGVDLFLPC